MNKISSIQVPPPSNWQDFESLCCDLWSRIWGDSNTQKNGRSGQGQKGVDICGVNYFSGEHCGIQCKGKDNYLEAKVTVSELDAEVESAKEFYPKLDVFILVTSGLKDSAIEARARKLTEIHSESNLFRVVVMGWKDILEKLDYYPDVQKKYYPWFFGNQEYLLQGDFLQLYSYWKSEVGFHDLNYYCCELPFFHVDVMVSNGFLVGLKSYLLKIDIALKDYEKFDSTSSLVVAVRNFNLVCRNLLNVCLLWEAKQFKGDIYLYWVKCDHLPRHQWAKFISYRKGVAKSLFYNLIMAANYVVKVRNGFYPDFDSYIDFKYDVGDVAWYPMYRDEDILSGRLYPGYSEVDWYIRQQIYPSLGRP